MRSRSGPTPSWSRAVPRPTSPRCWPSPPLGRESPSSRSATARRGGAAALALSRRAGAWAWCSPAPPIADSMDVDAPLSSPTRLRAEGGRPYVVPRGGATPVGACGFAGRRRGAGSPSSPSSPPAWCSPSAQAAASPGCSRASSSSGSAVDVGVVGAPAGRRDRTQVADLRRRTAHGCSASASRPLATRAGRRAGPGYGGGGRRRTRWRAHSGAQRFRRRPGLQREGAAVADRPSRRAAGPVLYWSTGGALAARRRTHHGPATAIGGSAA